jgi:hypothetical protein
MRYSPLGFCIYCGSRSNLEDEHTLPFALQGSRVLPAATCRSCATETGRLEAEVLRGPLWPVRAFRNLKSRSKHTDAPSEIEFLIKRSGIEETIRLPIDDAPIFMLFPVFDEPEYLRTGNPRSRGITVTDTDNIVFGRNPVAVLTELGATSITVKQESHPATFAKVIAKIAFSTAFGEGAMREVLDHRPLARAILGHTDDIGRWVGNVHPPAKDRLGALHQVTLGRDMSRDLLVATVQLFSDSQAPIYTVVLGQLARSGTSHAA